MPRLIALISAVWSISAFCGPLIGGSFATFGHWRFAFWASVAQAFIFLIAILLNINNDKPTDNHYPIVIPVGRLTIPFSSRTDDCICRCICRFVVISYIVHTEHDINLALPKDRQ